jgi:pyruvate dehydrogenase E2 component (dihydrolipoamide acetyltransferase)
MSTSVSMPRLSDSMEEGTVLRWIKRIGDAVAVGDELVEIETDKATITYDADVAGTLLEILVPEGETVALGVELARIGQPGENGATATAPTKPRVKASPVARRLAAELGIELAPLVGTGPYGRIVKADVEAAVAPPDAAAPPRPAPAPAPETRAGVPEPPGAADGRGPSTVIPLTRLQQTVARRMVEAKSTIPDFTLFADVDMSACVELRERFAEVTDAPPSYNDLVVKAAALTLRAHPRANAAFRDDHLELYERVNVGVAVAREDALVVPTIFDADQKSLGQIAREIARLAAAVRDGSVTPAELSGGTFTVSNLGMYAVSAFQPIINPGQAAILSVGAMTRRPVVGEDGTIVARHILTLGLVCDHRVIYGAQAAQLIRDLRHALEHPLAMAF